CRGDRGEAAAGPSLRREERAQGALQRGDPVGVTYPARGLRHDRPFADHAPQHGPVQMHPLLGPAARVAAGGLVLAMIIEPKATRPAEIALSRTACRMAAPIDSPATVTRKAVRSTARA